MLRSQDICRRRVKYPGCTREHIGRRHPATTLLTVLLFGFKRAPSRFLAMYYFTAAQHRRTLGGRRHGESPANAAASAPVAAAASCRRLSAEARPMYTSSQVARFSISSLSIDLSIDLQPARPKRLISGTLIGRGEGIL